LHHEDFRAADVLADLDAAFFILEFVDQRAAEARLHLLGDLAREIGVRIAAEE
jgi:hypothetical protein